MHAQQKVRIAKALVRYFGVKTSLRMHLAAPLSALIESYPVRLPILSGNFPDSPCPIDVECTKKEVSAIDKHIFQHQVLPQLAKRTERLNVPAR